MRVDDRGAYSFWTCADNYLLVDYGQIKSIRAGLKIVMLKNHLLESSVKGIIDLIPSNTSLLIGFDPHETEAETIKEIVNEILADIEKQPNIQMNSRMFTFPVYFADPWTKAAIDEYRETVKDKPYDVDFIIEQNGLKDLDEMIRYITTPQYIVTYMSIGPGLPSCVCMDPKYTLSVPKYNPPRTTTPEGSIGMGGSNISLYSKPSPGGYQLFGMLPTPLIQFEQTLPDFKESPVLTRAGDFFRFRSVGPEEFEAIKASCNEGTYRYEISEVAFDLNEYLTSIE